MKTPIIPPGHVPIVPPFPPHVRAALVNALADARRMKTDLQIAASAGLPVADQLAQIEQQIIAGQRLYDTYFSHIGG